MANIRRFFTEDRAQVGSEVGFSQMEFIHAIKTLRIKQGDEIIVCDGTEKEFRGIVNNISKNSFTCRIVSESLCDAEPNKNFALVCGFLKGDKTELVIREAVELGVSKIVIFSSDYCSAYMSENKLERLNKICIEASKQCGRSRAVPVEYVQDFKSALEKISNYNEKIFACEFENGKREKLTVSSDSVAVIIGSEGGFSDKESNLAIEYGCKSVGLGKRILRADTASTVCLSIVAYLLGELQ